MAACDAERRAQWDAYNAHKAALKQQQDAARADAEQRQQAAEQAERQRQDEQRIAQEKRAEREALIARHNAYARLVAAENAPDNQCKTPDVARALMQAWSDFDVFKDQNIRAVDIEHLTTTAFDPTSSAMSCHGIFVATKGFKIAGTLSIKKNVAGDPIENWVPDSSQDLSAYDAPPAMDPDTLKTITVASNSDAQSVPPNGTTTAAAFSEGLADRQRWELWISGLTGEEKEGALWYAANRNLRGNHDCAAQPKQDDVPWSAGCLTAQQRLTPVDLKRRSDPQYKRGWNSF
jgi:hypothetical protein